MNRNNRGPTPLWQLALYVAVLGLISLFLAPLTTLWWIVPLLGAAIPVVLALLQAQEHQGAAADDAPVATPMPDMRGPASMARPGPVEHPALKADGAPNAGVPASAALNAEVGSDLSPRELEVLTLLAEGKTNAEVAEALFISVGTVKSHSANIYRKLETKNRTEAVARARELGLLE